MKYLPTIALGIALAVVLSIDPTGASEGPVTLEDCRDDYLRADYESSECQALLHIEAMEAEFGPDYYNDSYDEWELVIRTEVIK